MIHMKNRLCIKKKRWILSEKECIICMTGRAPDVVNSPYLHRVMCSPCRSKLHVDLHRCPICNEPVNRFIAENTFFRKHRFFHLFRRYARDPPRSSFSVLRFYIASVLFHLILILISSKCHYEIEPGCRFFSREQL